MFRQAVYRKVTAYGGAGTPGITPTAGAWQLVGLIAPLEFDQRAHQQRLPLAPVGAPAVRFPDVNAKELRAFARTPVPSGTFWQRIPLAPVGDPAARAPGIQRPYPPAYVGNLSANYWQRLPVTPAVVILPAVAFPPPPFYSDFYKPTWNPSYWFQNRPVVVIVPAPPPVSVGGGMLHNLKPYVWTPAKIRRPWLPLMEEIAGQSGSIDLLALADAEDYLSERD
jgi:hypothetical protein